MPRKLQLHAHIPIEKLVQQARLARDLVEGRRWQLLVLIANDMPVEDAARLVGLNADYARRVVRRYNREGPASLSDRRKERTPPPPRYLLSAEQREELEEAVRNPAPGGGPWTGPAVARWIAEKTGRDHVRPQRGHDYLRRLRERRSRRPSHYTESNPDEAR